MTTTTNTTIRFWATGCLPTYLGNSRDGFCIEVLPNSVFRITHEINKRFWFEYQGDTVTDCQTIVGYNISGVNKQKIQYPNNFQLEQYSRVHHSVVEGWVKETGLRIHHYDIPNFLLTITKHDKTDAPPPPPEKKPVKPIEHAERVCFKPDDFPVLGKSKK